MESSVQQFISVLNENESATFAEKAQELLKFGCNLFELELGILSRINETVYTVLHAQAPDPEAIKPGDRFDLETTYCALVFSTGDCIGFTDIAGTEWTNHPAYAKFGLRAYFGAPISVRGQVFGTINFSSARPLARADAEQIRKSVSTMASWVNSELERDPEALIHCAAISSAHGR